MGRAGESHPRRAGRDIPSLSDTQMSLPARQWCRRDDLSRSTQTALEEYKQGASIVPPATLAATTPRSRHLVLNSIVLALPVNQPGWNIAGQQLLLRQQPCVLERLEIRQLAQRVEPEL